MTAREHLIIFVRYPDPGTAGARLIPALGEQGAAELHRALTEHALTAAQAFVRAHRDSRSLEIRFVGGGRDRMLAWLGNGITYTPQRTSDPKDRLVDALNDAFDAGAESVLVMDTGCPTLTSEHLETAHASLRTGDLAIGPAGDSGCYLIGMHRNARFQSVPALFKGIAWGSGYMLGDILSNAANLGLNYRLLERLPPVDCPEDLVVWDRARLSGNAAKPPLLSVIIPASNDGRTIGDTLESLVSGRELELIVADSGSTDDTVLTAISYGAHVIEASHGRAAQLSAGAAEASGSYLLFLAAGTVLEPGFDRAVREILIDPGVACGAFTCRIDSTQVKHRIIEQAIRFRAATLRLPAVGQGLFVRAETLSLAGGVPSLRIMGEFELAHRLGRLGRIVISPLAALIPPQRP